MRLLFMTILIKYVFSIEFKIFDGLVQVKSQSGLFFPLCSRSFTQKYGEQACSSISSTFSTYNVVSLQQYTYSIGCTTNVCFSFLSSYCKTGVKIYCTTGLCSPGTIQIGNKCLSFSTVPVQGYSAAQDYCQPFQLISSLKKSDIESISDTILPQLNEPLSFFTSGLRQGSRWKWTNGDTIDSEITGTGRCLALRSEQLVAVDCDSEIYAICEVGRECASRNFQYSGSTNRTAEHKPCLRWDDPSVLFGRKAEVPIVSHNFCRFVEENGRNSSTPVCYEKLDQLSPCYIPICPESFNDAVNKITEETCPSDSFSCDSGSKCISEKFRCDYEVDCNDGTDETDCEDYLQYFELIGAYRLADNIIEVWTFIPHVQGCARKCRESLLMCEAFSYEPKTQNCLLTDTSQTFPNLAQKITSLYYKRRFSSKDVLFQVENNILYGTKQNKRGQVCDENFSREKLSSICRVLGFGDSIYTSVGRQFDVASAHSSPSSTRIRTGSTIDEQPTSSSSSPLSSSSWSSSDSISPRLHHTQTWNLTCLREPNCTSTQFSMCQPIRCSRCQEAACSDGSCVKFSQLCDGISDCPDGFDESDCRGRSFRLINGSDTSGYLEVLFRSKWEPVCAEGLSSSPISQINSVCDTMRLGEQGGHLPTNRSIQFGWNVDCDVDCIIRRSTPVTCRHQARISCTSTNGISSSEQCGLRKVEVNARDAARSRFARVVGGFTTEAGAFPWTAAIRIKKTNSHHCGASILDRTHLITAAHCFEEDERPSTYEVVVGEWDNNQTEGTEQFFDVIKIHFYPLYKDIFSHDIAVVEISPSGIRFNDYVQPICLPTRGFVYTPGRQCVVSGWGSMGLKYANKLQAALIPIIDRFECVNSSQIYQSMSRSAFCAGYLDGGIDSCQGDSGGPFACRRQDGAFELAGVISWGDGCAQKKQPGIYTMVAPYLSWINSIITDS